MSVDPWTDEFGVEVVRAINIATAKIMRQWHAYVERDDLKSELYLFAWKKRTKFAEFDDPENPKESWKVLMSALERAGRRYARKMKAEKLGYSPSDEYFYQLETIADLIFAVGSNTGAPQHDDLDEVRGHAPLSERGNWEAMIIDASRALDALEPMDRGILLARFADERPSADVAEDWGITRQAVDARVARALLKMQDALGGVRP